MVSASIIGRLNNKMYGKEENSNQFTVPEELYRGQGLPGNERTGAAEGLPENTKGYVSGLSEFINKNSSRRFCY